MCVRACGRIEAKSWCRYLRHQLVYPLHAEAQFCLNPEHTDLANIDTQLVLGLLSLPWECKGCRQAAMSAQMYMSTGDPNPRPPDCVSSSLPTELSL